MRSSFVFFVSIAALTACGINGDDDVNAPFLFIVSPTDEVSGDISLEYIVRDQDGRFVNVFPYKPNSAFLNPATAAASSPSTSNRPASAQGKNSIFIWDSFADLGAGLFLNQVFRIDVVGRDGLGPPGLSFPFVVNNSDGFRRLLQNSSQTLNDPILTDPLATQLADSRVVLALGTEPGGARSQRSYIFDPRLGDILFDGPLLATPREEAAIARVQGGALICGGRDGSLILSSAERLRYEPNQEGTAEPAGSMLRARAAHRVSPLADGRALVLGGRDDQGLIDLAEVYTPALGFSALATDARLARQSPSVTLLRDGRVLFVGGADGSGTATAGVLLLDLSSGSLNITALASLNEARSAHAAALLDDGRVAIVAGTGLNGPLASIEIVDPQSGSVTILGSRLNEARTGAAAFVSRTDLTIVGGLGTNGLATNRAERLVLGTGQVASPRFPALLPRARATAISMGDGRALVLGGGATEIYQPPASSENDRFRSLIGSPRAKAGAASFVYFDEIVLYGGDNGAGPSADVEVFNLSTGTSELRGQLLTARVNHAAVTFETFPAGVMSLIAGGRSSTGVTDLCEIVEATGGRSRTVDTLAQAREGHFGALLPDGRVVVIGGRGPTGQALGSAEVFRPRDDERWTLVAQLQTPRSEFAGLNLFERGLVVVAGGLDGSGNAINDIEIFDSTTNQFRRIGNLSRGRRAPGLALSGDRRYLAVLGGSTSGAADADIIDLDNELVLGAVSLQRLRQGGQAVDFGNGQALIVGGFDSLGRDVGPELFEFNTLPLQSGGRVPTDGVGMLGVRRNSTAVLVQQNAVILGGQSGTGVVFQGGELYRP